MFDEETWPNRWYLTHYVPRRKMWRELFKFHRHNPHYRVPINFVHNIHWSINEVETLVALHESTLGRALRGEE